MISVIISYYYILSILRVITLILDQYFIILKLNNNHLIKPTMILRRFKQGKNLNVLSIVHLFVKQFKIYLNPISFYIAVITLSLSWQVVALSLTYLKSCSVIIYKIKTIYFNDNIAMMLFKRFITCYKLAIIEIDNKISNIMFVVCNNIDFRALHFLSSRFEIVTKIYKKHNNLIYMLTISLICQFILYDNLFYI